MTVYVICTSLAPGSQYVTKMASKYDFLPSLIPPILSAILTGNPNRQAKLTPNLKTKSRLSLRLEILSRVNAVCAGHYESNAC